MNKYYPIATLITLLLATASPVSAQSSVATASAAYSLEFLPPDIAEQVAYLMTFGDRYDKAIQQILLDAAKPDWSWND